MNIRQLARNQNMMYQIINRGTGAANPIQAQLSALNSSVTSGNQKGSGSSNLMQDIGISGMNGRTAREMAQYQSRVERSQVSTPASQTESAVSSTARQYATRQQYVPISDEATRDMQALALKDAKNSMDSAATDTAERTRLIRDHLQSVDPSKRSAAFNTMNKVWESELDRIGDYLKKNDSNWKEWGDKFDPTVLDNYKPGVNVWV